MISRKMRIAKCFEYFAEFFAINLGTQGLQHCCRPTAFTLLLAIPIYFRCTCKQTSSIKGFYVPNSLDSWNYLTNLFECYLSWVSSLRIEIKPYDAKEEPVYLNKRVLSLLLLAEWGVGRGWKVYSFTLCYYLFFTQFPLLL